jgi:hypothetical protein
VNSRIFCQALKNNGLDIVEGPAPSEMEKEIAHGGAGNMGAPATPGVIPHREKEKNEKKTFR